MPRTPAADSAPAGARGRVPVARPGAGRGGGAGPAVPVATLVSRRAGTVAWSPDGQTLAIATLSAAPAGYNGNPDRNDDDEPPVSAAAGDQVLWRVAAPRPIDEGARAVTLAAPAAGTLDRPVRSGLADAEVAVLPRRTSPRPPGTRCATNIGRGDGGQDTAARPRPSSTR